MAGLSPPRVYVPTASFVSAQLVLWPQSWFDQPVDQKEAGELVGCFLEPVL